MSDLDVRTEVSPPEAGEDGDDDRSMLLRATIIDCDDIQHSTSVQVFDEDCANAELIALALARMMVALGQLYGPDVAWAIARRVSVEP